MEERDDTRERWSPTPSSSEEGRRRRTSMILQHRWSDNPSTQKARAGEEGEEELRSGGPGVGIRISVQAHRSRSFLSQSRNSLQVDAQAAEFWLKHDVTDDTEKETTKGEATWNPRNSFQQRVAPRNRGSISLSRDSLKDNHSGQDQLGREDPKPQQSFRSAASSVQPPTLEQFIAALPCSQSSKEAALLIFGEEKIDLKLLTTMRDAQLKKLDIPAEVRQAIGEDLKKTKTGEDFTRWGLEELCAWLHKNNWAEYEPAVRRENLNGKSLLLLTVEDLCHTLGIKAGPAGQIILALHKMRSRFPLAFDQLAAAHTTQDTSWQKNQEFLAVPIEEMSDFAAARGRGWDRLVMRASHAHFSPVISFAGPTGCGKSRLITCLLSFEDRMTLRIPLVATQGQTQSTTGNVSLFKGSIYDKGKQTPLFLLDLEGENGTIPKELETEANRYHQSSSKIRNPRASINRDDPFQKRMAFVKEELPKIAYLLSNVLIYVDRQPMHNTGYLERVRSFSQRAAPGLNVSDRPHLIFVQNFCNDIQEDEYDIQLTSNNFLNLIRESRHLVDLEENFSSISYVKIPDAAPRPELFADQLYALQMLLLQKTKGDNSQGFMLNPNNFFTEVHWFRVVEIVLHKLQQRENEINMVDIFCQVCLPKDELLNRAVVCFNTLYQTLYMQPQISGKKMPWSGEHVVGIYEERVKNFEDCMRLTLLKMAETFVVEWKDQKIVLTGEHLDRPAVRDRLQSHFDKCYELLLRRAPCGYHTSSSICVHEKLLHGDKHRLVSKSLLPAWSKGKTATGYLLPPFSTNISKEFFEYAKKLMELSAPEFFSRRLALIRYEFTKKIQEPDVASKIRNMLSPECLICLQYSANVLLSCGHTICRRCSFIIEDLMRRYGEYLPECPFCGQLSRQLKLNCLQQLQRPRVLSLDGGGIRTLVQLTILNRVELFLNLPISHLFDLVAGTGAGALVTGLLGVAKKTIAESEKTYIRISKSFFQRASIKPKIVWNALVSSRFESAPLEEALVGEFERTTLLEIAPGLPKVLILAHDKDKGKQYEFGSFAAPNVDWNARVSEAIFASLLSPVFYDSYVYQGRRLCDGGSSKNNPAVLAFQHARGLSGRAPGLVVSIGTGKNLTGEAHSGDPVREAFVDAVTNAQLSQAACEQLCSGSCYFRFDGPALADKGLDNTSKATRKLLISETEAYCDSEEVQKDMKEVCMHLLAQLFYVTKDGTTLYLQARDPRHFKIDGSRIIWTDRDSNWRDARLGINIKDTRTGISAGFKVVPVDNHLAIHVDKEGEYLLEAHVRSTDNDTARYPISSSPCYLWLERDQTRNLVLTIGLKWTLSVTIQNVTLTTPASYCIVHLGDEDRATRHLPNSLEPEWQKLAFHLRRQPTDVTLDFQLFDISGEHVGCARLTLAEDLWVGQLFQQSCKVVHPRHTEGRFVVLLTLSCDTMTETKIH